MLGIKDPVIYLAYILTMLSAVACVIYGIINWNKGTETETNDIAEEQAWEKKDKKITKSL